MWRSKAAFWALTLAFLGLASVPSVVLLQSIRHYVRFLSGWDPGVLKPSMTRRLPHRSARSQDVTPSVVFVEFHLKAAKAKQVLLLGDFNQWQPDIVLKKGGQGAWETVLALPPGQYRYLFHVDGEWVSDPKAPKGSLWEDHATSLREVK